VGEFTILDSNQIPSIVREAGIKVAMLAVPAAQAQAAANMLVEAGVKTILNYAPITLNLPAGVRVSNIDPLIHLQRMAYYLTA
jgi:redox-sensing transcriptional repressor